MDAPHTHVRRLNGPEWAYHHNESHADEIAAAMKSGNLSVQTKEILRLIPPGSSVLEIGSGSGQSAVALAMQGCSVTAMDYEQKCLDLTSTLAERMGVTVATVKADAEKPLPFIKDQFDYIFHAGLLEHYTKEERHNLLTLWYTYGRKMISMVPNAACIAYRTGKARMEKKGTWSYGIERPLYTAKDEFIAAGYEITDEYTAGEKHALSFLPRWHFLRLMMYIWITLNPSSDNCGQGYLLITVGKKL